MTSIEIITRNDLCVSCGACEHACPLRIIHMRFNRVKGQFEPWIESSEDCTYCENKECALVCPSYSIDFTELNPHHAKPSHIGPVVNIYTGYVKQNNIRKKASSGGIIRIVSRYLLESRKVDAVITLAKTGPMRYEPIILDNPAELENLPTSIYQNVNFSKAISLIENGPERILLIAIPCHLSGIYKYLKRQPHLSAKIWGTIGLICGWMYSYHSIWAFAEYNKIPPSQITGISYRGDGKIGDLKIDTPHGNHRFNRRPRIYHGSLFFNYKTAFSRTFNLKRCHYCREHVNYLADLVVGDAWLRRFSREKFGTSLIITRRRLLDEMILKMADEKLINLTPATEEDITESQSKDFAFGISGKKLAELSEKRGFFTPKFRLWEDVDRVIVDKIRPKYPCFYQLLLRHFIKKKKYRLVRSIKSLSLLLYCVHPLFILNIFVELFHRYLRGLDRT